MKKVVEIMKVAIIALTLCLLAFELRAQTPSTVPSMCIGGIEVKGIALNKDVIRTVIYKSLVTSKKYVVNDRFDVAEKVALEKLNACMGKDCLIEVGKLLNADYAMSISYDGLGDRILISLKIVDIKTQNIVKNEIGQFENQISEINRMTDIMIYKVLEIAVNENVDKMLAYKDSPALSSGPGKMNNSGPRIGLAYVTGQSGDMFTRSEKDGGLASYPMLFNIGYQLEAQYVGTENFSGLFEFIFNVGGLDQGLFIPSLAILHGARFGKNSWEIAIGPSLSVKTLSEVTSINGHFLTKSELNQEGIDTKQYEFNLLPDTRGAAYFSSSFMIGIGRTFHSGAINIPVNAYVSLNKYGTGAGLSMGMNINKSKQKIRTRS